MKLRTVKDLHPRNKRVLLGVDYNVPISSGIVGDPLRIQASFETIRYLLDHNCSIVLISHLGRPKGKVVKEMSLAPVAQKAAALLNHPIGFVHDCVGPGAVARARALKPREILLLENTRFHSEEEASLGEVFIDDAFANIHRDHASVTGVAKVLPSAAGFLVEREVKNITEAIKHPAKPLVAVVAGAKVSTKIEVLDNLMKHVDRLMIGGAMANTFLKAQGHNVGKSLVEADLLDEARRIITGCAEHKVDLILPEDVVVAAQVEHGPARTVDLDGVKKDDYIVDIGSKTISHILNPLDFHGTVIWNGPLGITEVPEFSHGSRVLAESIMESGARSIIGGGDTAAFVDEAGWHDKFTWVSTGGGASLELMAGRELPGLKVL
jgi:phosphoglycerate kinase